MLHAQLSEAWEFDPRKTLKVCLACSAMYNTIVYNSNKYDEASNLQVLFVGEGALDYGGPKRVF